MQLALGLTRTMQIYSTPVTLQLLGSQRLCFFLQLQGFPATHSIVIHCACKADAAFSWWLDEESCKDRMFNLCITTVSLDGKTDAVKATAQKSATACWVPARSHWSNVVPMESDGVRGSSRESGFTGRTSLWSCCCWGRPAAALHGDLNLNEFLTYTGESRPSRTIKYFMCNIRQSRSTYILNQQNWKTYYKYIIRCQ